MRGEIPRVGRSRVRWRMKDDRKKSRRGEGENLFKFRLDGTAIGGPRGKKRQRSGEKLDLVNRLV